MTWRPKPTLRQQQTFWIAVVVLLIACYFLGFYQRIVVYIIVAWLALILVRVIVRLIHGRPIK